MNNTQVLPCIANRKRRAYSSRVAAKSATGFGHSNKLAQQRPSNTKAGAFLLPVTSRYDGRMREALGLAGCQLSQLTNLCTAVTNSFGHERDSSKPKVGAPHMKYILALNPSKIRAAAHRRMAFAALHADSSLKTRLTRYQHHINQARALEAAGGAV